MRFARNQFLRSSFFASFCFSSSASKYALYKLFKPSKGGNNKHLNGAGQNRELCKPTKQTVIKAVMKMCQ